MKTFQPKLFIQFTAPCHKRRLIRFIILFLVPVFSVLQTKAQTELYGGYVTNPYQTINPGEIPALINCTAATGGNCGGNYTYQWKRSTDNINWVSIGGATGQNYQPVALTITTYYRRETYCGGEVGYTETNATITVIGPLCPGSIVGGNQQVPSGNTHGEIYATPASGGNCGGNYIYQWQISTDNAYFEDIPGANFLSLYFTKPITQTTYFQRKVTCGNEVKYTNSMKVSVGAVYNTSLIGGNGYFNGGNIETVSNTFTVEFWVKPTSTHKIDVETNSHYVYDGMTGQKFAIAAVWGGDLFAGKAGMGVSVGTNGISVYEHAAQYIPSTLVWEQPVTGWTHVAIVYQNRVPSLYVNGQFVRTGLVSGKNFVYPGTSLLGDGYGSFAGNMDEIRIWNYARTPQQIVGAMATHLIGTETGLVAYWPLNHYDGQTIVDVSGHGYNLTLPAGYTSNNWSIDVPFQ